MDNKFEEFERIVVFGLTYQCPFEIYKSNCPAKELRDLDLDKSYMIIEGMSEDEIHNIYTAHQRCSRNKVCI